MSRVIHKWVDAIGHWSIHANCRGIDPDVMFPVGDNHDAIDTAKAICNACTVRDECLEYALTNRINDGVWGGASEKERRRILRARRGAA